MRIVNAGGFRLSSCGMGRLARAYCRELVETHLPAKYARYLRPGRNQEEALFLDSGIAEKEHGFSRA